MTEMSQRDVTASLCPVVVCDAQCFDSRVKDPLPFLGFVLIECFCMHARARRWGMAVGGRRTEQVSIG